MTPDPIQLDTATQIGAWLATYWLHAAVAIGGTWVFARTVLRDAPAGLRAFAWRAALVVPLVTSAVRCGLVTGGHQLEMAWLGRTAVVADVAEPAVPETPEARETSPRGFELAGNGVARAASTGENIDARRRGERRTNGSKPLRSWTGAHVSRPAPQRADNDRPDVAARVAAPESSEPAAESVPTVARTGASADAPAPAPAAASVAVGAPVAESRLAALLRHWSSVDPRRLALLVAAIAALLALARWLDGWLRLGRQLGRTRPLVPERAERAAHLARIMGVAHTRIVQSDRVRVPLAYGFVTPRVCLPTDFHVGLTADEWDAAVAHELAHVVRGDQRWLPTLRLVARVFAFQPLNRLAWRELQRDSEHAADETAVRVVGAAEPLALCLAKVATRVRSGGGPLPAAAVTGAPTMAGRMSLVVERADRILSSADLPPRRARRMARLAAIAPTVVVALALPRLAPAIAFGQTLAVPDPVAPVLADSTPARAGRSSATVDTTPRFDLANEWPSEPASSSDPSPAPGSTTALLAHESSALGLELAAARDELRDAFQSSDASDRARLVAVLERLERLEQQHDLLARLIHERDDPAKSSPLAPSPDLDPERDTQR